MAPWPPAFSRVPDEAWASASIEALARGYDTVERHGWYENLEPTVDRLTEWLGDDSIVLDYSGGTGILADRLFRRAPQTRSGMLIVDSSPKFLRLALEKHGADERVAFRLIRFHKATRSLDTVDEVVGGSMLERGVDVLVSTNAVHLYYDLVDTLRSWKRVVRPSGRVHVQSGNIRNPDAPPGSWIIDETVESVHAAAIEIVRDDDRYAGYRDVLDDAERMSAYDRLRQAYFLPVRPLAHYLDALDEAGFETDRVEARVVPARTHEWREFLSVYHEGALGWIGGAAKIEGAAATEEAVGDRLELLGTALDRVLGGAATFDACWTYVDCRPRT